MKQILKTDNKHPCKCGCGTLIHIIDKYYRKRFYCKGHDKRGKKQKFPHRFKTGRIIDKKGYIKLYRPNHHFATKKGYVYEHRIIFEEYYNCCLLPYFDIHHINHNKHDNRIENLEPILKIIHTRKHLIERARLQILKNLDKRICIKCGHNHVTKAGKNKNGKRYRYSCKGCNRIYVGEFIKNA